MAGVTFTEHGLQLAPAPLPAQLQATRQRGAPVLFSLHTPAVGLVSYANGSWAGHYRADKPGEARAFSLSLTLPCAVDRALPSRLHLSCSSEDNTRITTVSNAVRTRTPSTAEVLRWEANSPETVAEASLPLPAACLHAIDLSWLLV